MPDFSPQQILAVPMRENRAEAATVRDYLVATLAAFATQQDAFSSKRPFGNSDWTWRLYESLGDAGVIDITLDENDYIADMEDSEQEKADQLILDAINALN